MISRQSSEVSSESPLNPYKPPDSQALGGVYGEGARRLKGGFLYRKIEFSQPFKGIFVYNGWNFLQRVFIEDHLVWKRISWVVIHRRAEFQLPSQVDPEESCGDMEIRFGPALWIRRFTIRIKGVVVYDE